MTKPEFANIPNGTHVRNVASGFHYRVYARIGRNKMILSLYSIVASAARVETISITERAEWQVVQR